MNRAKNNDNPADRIFATLDTILGEYAANRQRDTIIWESMSEEARYGKMIALGVSPFLADKYDKRPLAIIPSPVFDLLMNNL